MARHVCSKSGLPIDYWVIGPCPGCIAESSTPPFEGAQPPMSDALKPAVTLLCKLGSIVVHADEMLSADGHAFDAAALRSLLADADVQSWCIDMASMALVPLKRSAR